LCTLGGGDGHIATYAASTPPPPEGQGSPKLTLQFKARSDLGQLHTAVAGLPIYMVPEGDIVILVREGDDPVAVIFGHREQVTEYVGDPLA